MNQIYHNTLKELRQRRWAVLSYCAIALGFLWLYVATYPSIANSSLDLNQIYKAIPRSVMEAFNIGQPDASFAGYFASKHLVLVWPLMASLLTISTAGMALAGEIERTTMALLLSLPVTRARLYMSKYFGGVAVFTIFTLISVPTAIPIAALYDVKIDAGNVLIATWLCWCFALAVFSIGFAVSAIVRERGKVYFVTGGLLLSMYVGRIMSSLVNSLDHLKYLSFFYYFGVDKALSRGELSLVSMVVFLGSSVVAFFVGLVAFKRRDVSV